MYDLLEWVGEAVDVILCIIMIARLHAMYQRSRKVLIFLVLIFLAISIADVAMAAIFIIHSLVEEYVLSGTYQCMVGYKEDMLVLGIMTWVLVIIWEVIALCLAVWVVIKHLHELRQHSASGIIEDCFTVLMRTHVSYFVSILAFSGFRIGLFSTMLSADMYSLDAQIYLGLAEIIQFVQMSVLGPRLILGVREYHAELVANSDTATTMTSNTFQERIHVSTRSSV
ncbi:hypothetical protein BDR07DRAFT_1428378 [Suillus spraguei]|nr:hypothetical protein BDR07DRAFT_1428378 [Suillus spraguei]